ncbi:NFX1-type zinc finger-containing protein 1-like [Apostichopus japonicus]|uniref:NFX1-type zinc finger-containing protein 1-like n=1 Tax=Stichopus japonicus TaxID=307972 RepID=UPI003AB3088D
MASKFPTSVRGRSRRGRGNRHDQSGPTGFRGEVTTKGPDRSESNASYQGRARGRARGRGRGRGRGSSKSTDNAGGRGISSNQGSHPHDWRLANTSTRKTNPMGINLLTRLITTEPNDFTRLLYENRTPLELLLKQQNMDNEIIQLLINVLSKACRVSDQQSERMIEVFNIVKVSNFLDINLVQWIPKWTQLCFTQDVLEKNLLSTIDICTKMLDKFPGTVSAVGVTLLVLNSVVESFEKNDIFVTSEVKEKFTSLRDTHATFLRDSKELSARRDRRMPDNSRESPPDDFREIPVLPCPDELRSDYKPFLRKNIVNGEYDDLNHYLDIHYRLLREDFIAPIREGIAEYTDELSRNGAKAKKRFQNLRLYNNVQAVGIDPSKGGISYILRFDVDNHLKRVKWELGKRLIFGSLICLSRDDFKTLIFGVVANSDPKQLKQGFVEVTFDVKPDLVQEIFTYSFKMAESPSYFEAYRHILGCLQDINEDDFPFAQYIINTTRKPDLPLYIREKPGCKFDLSDLNNIALEDAEQMSCQVDVQKLKEVCVRDDENWPSHETLGFDESQMLAYQAALREEVCLIQGPPGTGKTYVGLRIVKTLLRNRAWLGNNMPLMVVCYTNHALDQFLEGITEFEPNGVVRIGGRSSSEKLRDFNLRKLRQSAGKGKTAKWEYGQVRREMVSTAKKIENSEKLVHVAKKGLLKYEILQQFMDFSHRESLTCLPYLSASSDPIAFWLGILDEVGECCVDPSNTYQKDVHFSASKERTEPKRNLNAAINAEMISEGEESDISEDNKVDSFQTREEDTTDTEASIVFENEEFERRYIDDEDDTSDDEFVNTFHRLALKIPEETIVALPDANKTTDESKWVKVRRRNAQKTALFIRHRLAEGNVMNEKEIKRVRDVWHLHSHQRWSLYRHWVQRYTEQI